MREVATLRHYLLVDEVETFTDHHALRCLITIQGPSGRLMRWWLRLSEFKFTVCYKKSKNNQVADLLARIPTSGRMKRWTRTTFLAS